VNGIDDLGCYKTMPLKWKGLVVGSSTPIGSPGVRNMTEEADAASSIPATG